MPMVLRKRYECSNGDVWEEFYAEYDNDKYFEDGRDEVIQIQKNGREEGHITWHYDGDGVMRQKNEHGHTSIPSDCM